MIWIENKERDKRKMRLKWNGEVEHTNLKTLLSIKPKLSNYWGRSVRIILDSTGPKPLETSLFLEKMSL